MGKFSGYSSRAVVANILQPGEHRVKLVAGMELNSFISSDGTRKDKEYQWENPTDQFLIHCVSVEGKGSIMHRLQGQGWKKFADLTDSDIKSKKFTNLDGYACIKTKTGFARVEDAEATAKCDRIIDRFMGAIGAPEGSGMDYVDTAIAEGTEFMIVVVNDEFEGKDQLKIKSFKPVANTAPVVNDMEA